MYLHMVGLIDTYKTPNTRSNYIQARRSNICRAPDGYDDSVLGFVLISSLMHLPIFIKWASPPFTHCPIYCMHLTLIPFSEFVIAHNISNIISPVRTWALWIFRLPGLKENYCYHLPLTPLSTGWRNRVDICDIHIVLAPNIRRKQDLVP